jgi:hypothetical protein
MAKLKNSVVPYFYYKEEIEEKKKGKKENIDTKENVEKRIQEIERKVEAIKCLEIKKKDEEDWEDDEDVPPLE